MFMVSCQSNSPMLAFWLYTQSHKAFCPGFNHQRVSMENYLVFDYSYRFTWFQPIISMLKNLMKIITEQPLTSDFSRFPPLSCTGVWYNWHKKTVCVTKQKWQTFWCPWTWLSLVLVFWFFRSRDPVVSSPKSACHFGTFILQHARMLQTNCPRNPTYMVDHKYKKFVVSKYEELWGWYCFDSYSNLYCSFWRHERTLTRIFFPSGPQCIAVLPATHWHPKHLW